MEPIVDSDVNGFFFFLDHPIQQPPTTFWSSTCNFAFMCPFSFFFNISTSPVFLLLVWMCPCISMFFIIPLTFSWIFLYALVLHKITSWPKLPNSFCTISETINIIQYWEFSCHRSPPYSSWDQEDRRLTIKELTYTVYNMTKYNNDVILNIPYRNQINWRFQNLTFNLLKS